MKAVNTGILGRATAVNTGESENSKVTAVNTGILGTAVAVSGAAAQRGQPPVAPGVSE